MNQPNLFPERTTNTITVKVEHAEAAVARIRELGGVLLSFSPVGGGMLELHVLLDATMLAQVLEGGR